MWGQAQLQGGVDAQFLSECADRVVTPADREEAMVALRTSLAGRVRNTNLPKSHSLLPLLEAVVNGLQAIDVRFGDEVGQGSCGSRSSGAGSRSSSSNPLALAGGRGSRSRALSWRTTASGSRLTT
jgi:hypothetical protein